MPTRTSNPLIRIENAVGVFAPQYYGSIEYYATMAKYRHVVIDRSMRYNKRFKSVHRCDIVDTHGILRLTVPVAHDLPKDNGIGPSRHLQWQDLLVSSHGQWWADHRVSLESAYGRTPYFEYYIDRFMPWLRHPQHISIVDFDLGLDEVVRRTIGMESVVTTDVEAIDMPIHDYRDNKFDSVKIAPYYQVRADRLGFVPSLSILDLLFNMGPEAALVLRAYPTRNVNAGAVDF